MTVFGDHVITNLEIGFVYVYKLYSSPKSEMLKSAQVASSKHVFSNDLLLYIDI